MGSVAHRFEAVAREVLLLERRLSLVVARRQHILRLQIPGELAPPPGRAEGRVQTLGRVEIQAE